MTMRSFGSKTPPAVIYKHESHKLHQAFPVKDGEIIITGMPVMLEADGTISPYLGTGIYLGIAVNADSRKPIYPPSESGVEVTVMVEAFALIKGTSAAIQDAGYVKPGAITDTDKYVPYSVSGTDTNGDVTPTNFIQINPSSEAGELVQILVK